MAFIGSEKREFHMRDDRSTLGPGKYQLSPSSATKTSSYAPFSSLDKRFTVARQQKLKQHLGPGSYEINRALGKPSFTKIENDHSIIVKIHDFGSSAFRSNVERFKGPETLTPGPGEYVHVQDNKKMSKESKSVPKLKGKRRALSHEHHIINQLKQQNKRYNESKELYSLVKQQKKSEPSKPIGPGTYEHPSPFDQIVSGTKKPKGICWSLNQKERFATQQREGTYEESYYQAQVDQIKRDRQKTANIQPSNVFKSETVKTFFDNICYQTNNHMKAEIRKRLGFKDPGPAPGSYLPVYHSGAGKKQCHNWRFQFFGSTEQRFVEKTDDTKVGPASYIIKDTFMKTSFRKPKTDNSKRSELTLTKEDTPGPGYYRVETPMTKEPGKVQEFGSLMPRFKTDPSQDQRQTGEQSMKELNDSARRRNYPNNKIQALSSCMFRSNTQRDAFDQKSRELNLPLGEYNISSGDIGAKMAKKRGYLLNLQYCFLKRPAFDSTLERFRDPLADKKGATINKIQNSLNIQIKDQKYSNKKSLSEHKSLQQQRNNTFESTKSAVFKSNVKRAPFGNKKSGPAVGMYESQQYLVRKSFNKRYQSQPKK